MKKYTILLDYGHGGIIDGVYQTYPHKMYTFQQDGFVIYEGEINRKIGKYLEMFLDESEIEYKIISEGQKDIPLFTRINIANKYYEQNKLSYGISIHSNCSSMSTTGIGSKAHGFEIFTSPGETPSDPLGQEIALSYMNSFPDVVFRKDISDRDYDKEAKLAMLTKTKSPFMLVENLFFDNRTQANFLASTSGQLQIANCIYKGILAIEEKQLL